MATSRVISLSRDDENSAAVLVNITSSGPRPLDVKLVGTEGEEPYHITLRHDKIAALRVKNSPVSELEWRTILESLFAQKPLPDIQATASIQSEESLSITIRKQVQGITQRLGSIILKCDRAEGIELFEWCVSSNETLAERSKELALTNTRVSELEDEVKMLKAQLNELVAMKQDDETALLHKFRDLLNEKKVKIREQQKIIASAAIPLDDGALSSEAELAAPESSRKPAKSRPTKRKAPATRIEEESSSDESQDPDPDKMEVDKIKEEPQDSDGGELTDGTASEATDEEEEQDGGKSATEAQTTETTEATTAPVSKKAAEKPPAPRSLPFATKKAVEAKPPITASPGAGSETQSDDEL